VTGTNVTKQSFNVSFTVTLTPSGNLKITIDFPMSELGTVTGVPTSVSKAAFFAGTTIALTAPSGMTGISWSIGGESITVGLSAGDRVLTISKNDTEFLKYFAGSSFVVNLKGTIGGKQYSKSVMINLDP